MASPGPCTCTAMGRCGGLRARLLRPGLASRPPSTQMPSHPKAGGPGFGCRIRTEPVSDPNPKPRRPIRSEPEPGVVGTDPKPDLECRNRSESKYRVPTLGNRSESELGGKTNPNPESGPKPRQTRVSVICTYTRCRDTTMHGMSHALRILTASAAC